MKGPCMCGAIDCKSCGPAQGYRPCPACGEYGNICEHTDEDGELTEAGESEIGRREAAQEWTLDQRIDAQRDDLGDDPREYAYWNRLM